MSKVNGSEVRFLGRIRWKEVGMQSIRYFVLLITMFLITYTFVGVGLAIHHSILVEEALAGVFASLVDGIPVTVPLAVCGGVFLAFMKQVIETSEKSGKNMIPTKKEILLE